MGEYAVAPARIDPASTLGRLATRAVSYAYDGLRPGAHIGMPSTSLTLVVSLDDPIRVGDAEGDPTAYGTCLAGLTTRPARIHHGERMRGVQLDLRPSAARRLLGVPAGEVAGPLELADLLGPAADELREQLHACTRPAQMLDLIEAAFAASEHPASPSPEVAEAWRLVHARGGNVRVHALADHVGWSTRRLQQRFREETGLTPKEAALVCRFDRSRRLVARGDLRLGEIATRCGYADQAHLNRDWRRFAGTTPGRWPDEDTMAPVLPVAPPGRE